MRVSINGVVRTARPGSEGTVLLTNGTEIEGVVLPSGRVVWTDDGVDPTVEFGWMQKSGVGV